MPTSGSRDESPQEVGRRHVAIFSCPGDEAWSAVLTADLVSHGVAAIDAARAGRAAALDGAKGLILVSGSAGTDGPEFPTDEEVAEVKAHKGAVFIARCTQKKLDRDRHFHGYPTLGLWDHYYQPAAAPAGKISGGGWANVLEAFGGRRPAIYTQTDYVFISYRHDHDGDFVRSTLRGALALGGFASWDYRATERIADHEGVVCRRLVELVAGSAAVVLVGTSQWSADWTELELAVARCLDKPIVVVRPTTAKPSRKRQLSSLPTEVLVEHQRVAPATVAALVTAGVRCAIPPHDLRSRRPRT